MFWILLASLFLGIGIFLRFTNTDWRGDPGLLFGTSVTTFMFVLICSILSIITWQQKKYKLMYHYPVRIENKVLKIQMVKKAFIQNNQNKGVNIDMVNQSLTIKIADEIKDLEEYINEYNRTIIDWRIFYRYRFFTFCFTKVPTIKLLKLKDIMEEKYE